MMVIGHVIDLLRHIAHRNTKVVVIVNIIPDVDGDYDNDGDDSDDDGDDDSVIIVVY